MITHDRSAPTIPSRVVVLGASGFVGRHVVDHLNEIGVETLPLSSSDVDLCLPGSVDALRRIVREADALLLVSAITPDRGRDVSTMMRNLTMVQHVCAFLERGACGHVVYVSSDAVYEDSANPVRETSVCHPSTLHGLMHIIRERMLWHAVQKLRVPLLCLRPCAIYGAGDTHNSYGPNRFVRTARRERKITLFGSGEEKRDHLHVGDVSRLIGACLLNRSEGTLNVATGTSVSFLAVAQMVARMCETAVEMECLPRSGPITHRHFDVAALRRAFPDFRFTSLEIGLSETLKAIVDKG